LFPLNKTQIQAQRLTLTAMKLSCVISCVSKQPPLLFSMQTHSAGAVLFSRFDGGSHFRKAVCYFTPPPRTSQLLFRASHVKRWHLFFSWLLAVTVDEGKRIELENNIHTDTSCRPVCMRNRKTDISWLVDSCHEKWHDPQITHRVHSSTIERANIFTFFYTWHKPFHLCSLIRPPLGNHFTSRREQPFGLACFEGIVRPQSFSKFTSLSVWEKVQHNVFINYAQWKPSSSHQRFKKKSINPIHRHRPKSFLVLKGVLPP